MPIAILTTHPLRAMFSDRLSAPLKDEAQFIIHDGYHAFSRIHDVLSREKVDLVLARIDGVKSLHEISKIIHSDGGHKVILVGDHAPEVIFEYIKAGIKGYLDSSISPDLLGKAIHVVHRGEVWFDRKTSSRVLELFAVREAEKRQNRKIDLLTVREKEVLMCVSHGLKNREIADSLFISESTVKTHLYRIYDKLGVSDRLAAALMMREGEYET
ncbi:MAG: DNA-binding response regulator [Zetaproteobacteria bacterium CG_4_9_14_3_um_filter_54_145]|nr:MAG: DNA-binding response regulator [Zetaproteobacteria bacterium CG_4_10_14_3_um_filter_54_28]PJA27229.1 MAG: DNA-binding response regulator [Zetaproteobacteria bacterium CG_4_9_14_3_um_filter_54_145]